MLPLLLRVFENNDRKLATLLFYCLVDSNFLTFIALQAFNQRNTPDFVSVDIQAIAPENSHI